MPEDMFDNLSIEKVKGGKWKISVCLKIKAKPVDMVIDVLTPVKNEPLFAFDKATGGFNVYENQNVEAEVPEGKPISQIKISLPKGFKATYDAEAEQYFISEDIVTLDPHGYPANQ